MAPTLQSTPILFPHRDGYHDQVSRLKDAGFTLLADLCAVDYLTHPGRTLADGVNAERFEVVVNLLSMGVPVRQAPVQQDPVQQDGTGPARVRVRVQVPEGDPVVDSLWDLYPGAEGMEREAFDLFGILFTGHPDLTRILMPDDWEGHPLRKDYGVGRVPIQFKAAPGPR